MFLRLILILALTSCINQKRVVKVERRLDYFKGSDNQLVTMNLISCKVVNYCLLDSNKIVLRIDLTNVGEYGIYVYDPPIILMNDLNPNPPLHHFSSYLPLSYFTYLGAKKTKEFLIEGSIRTGDYHDTLFVCLNNYNGIYNEKFKNVSWKLDRYICIDSLLINNYNSAK